jgi:dTMP kinase
MDEGFFISFEGIDKCGKTTQIELLKKCLTSKHYEVIVAREPGGTPVGERIKDILKDKKGLEMNPLTEMVLFNASRAEFVREYVAPVLARGGIFMADRFYDSTTAYQGYGRGIDRDDIAALLRVVLRRPEGRDMFYNPSLTFVLDISVDESYRRRGNDVQDRIEKSGREFYERVREGYKIIANGEPHRVVLLNGEDPPEEVHKKIEVITYRKLADHKEMFKSDKKS